MAIYHLSVKHGSRKQGKSAAAHANYIARQGTYAKGRYVEDFVHAESWNMPDWSTESAVDFWQAADTYERANGRLYTEIEIALPRELDQTQQLDLVRDFVSAQVGAEHPVTWAVHNRPALDGGMNPHAHIMLSERTLDGVERNAELFFKRANAAHPEKGGAAKDPAWNHRDKVEQLRQAWEATANRVLQRAGLEVSLDHRSLQAQGIDRAPEPKLGPEQTAMLHRGELTEDAERVLELRQGRAQQAVLEHDITMIDRRVSRQEREASGAPLSDLGAATVAETRSPKVPPQPEGVTPAPAGLAGEPQQTDAASHRDMLDTGQRPQVSLPGVASGHESRRQDMSGAEAPQPTAPQPDLSWSQRLERLLPDDLLTLKSIWEREYRRRFEQVRDKAQRVEDKVRSQMAGLDQKRRDHQAGEPQAPKGWRTLSKQRRFMEAQRAWHWVGSALETRFRQLSKRLSHVVEYYREGTSPLQPSPGEQLAEKRLEAERPELVQKFRQMQAQEDERQRAIATRERRQADADLSVVHPYLTAHGVGAYGVRCDSNTGDLIIPIRNIEGNLRSFQRIDAEGQARFVPGWLSQGHFHQVGERQAGEPILIAEAYVTAVSIYEATGLAVVVAFEAENLKPVAEAWRAREPETPMLICGDNDRHLGVGEKNVGRYQAEEAAKAVGGQAVVPMFTTEEFDRGLRDFNDLRQSRSLNAVKRHIEGMLRRQAKQAQEQKAQLEMERNRQELEPHRQPERVPSRGMEL